MRARDNCWSLAPVPIVTLLVLASFVTNAQAEDGTPAAASVSVSAEAGPAPEAPTVEVTLGSTAAPASVGGNVQVHIDALVSLDPAARIEAVRALEAARAESGVGPLIRVLQNDPDPTVRGWAVRALGAIGTAEARAALAAAAQRDSDERVRGLSVQLLGQVTASPFAVTAQPTVAPVETGRPHPFSRQRRRSPGLGLIIAGWSVFGMTYLASIIGGGAAAAEGSDDVWPLFIPVVGPWIEASWQFDRTWGEPFAVMAIIDAVAQIAGLTLAIIGHARRARHRREEGGDEQETVQARSRAPIFAVVPTGPAGSTGLSVSALF